MRHPRQFNKNQAAKAKARPVFEAFKYFNGENLFAYATNICWFSKENNETQILLTNVFVSFRLCIK